MGVEIYILAAVLPAAVLLFFIYKQDRIEKEPPALILKLLLMGVLSALMASAVESLGMGILDRAVSESNPYYIVLLAFLVVAVTEDTVVGSVSNNARYSVFSKTGLTVTSRLVIVTVNVQLNGL